MIKRRMKGIFASDVILNSVVMNVIPIYMGMVDVPMRIVWILDGDLKSAMRVEVNLVVGESVKKLIATETDCLNYNKTKIKPVYFKKVSGF